jgi:hypothetical protein
MGKVLCAAIGAGDLNEGSWCRMPSGDIYFKGKNKGLIRVTDETVLRRLNAGKHKPVVVVGKEHTGECELCHLPMDNMDRAYVDHPPEGGAKKGKREFIWECAVAVQQEADLERAMQIAEKERELQDAVRAHDFALWAMHDERMAEWQQLWFWKRWFTPRPTPPTVQRPEVPQ